MKTLNKTYHSYQHQSFYLQSMLFKKIVRMASSLKVKNKLCHLKI